MNAAKLFLRTRLWRKATSLLACLVITICCFGLLHGSAAERVSCTDSSRQRLRQLIGGEAALGPHLTTIDVAICSFRELLTFGRRIFNANLTEDGSGRPLTKGTGRPITDPSLPMKGLRVWNRFSGPDANSCAGWHNSPYGIVGGAGDLVTNVFELDRRIEFATFDPNDNPPLRGTTDEGGKVRPVEMIANSRASTGPFGAGYLEMLARQVTADLQHIRCSINGDGVKNELTRADIPAANVFQAALQVPCRAIPSDREIEATVLDGEEVFRQFGCRATEANGKFLHSRLGAPKTQYSLDNCAIAVAILTHSLIDGGVTLPTAATLFQTVCQTATHSMELLRSVTAA